MLDDYEGRWLKWKLDKPKTKRNSRTGILKSTFCAYVIVEIVSSLQLSDGETFAIMAVCEFPPRESRSRRVKIESR